MPLVCVYCGSSDAVPAAYLDAARDAGLVLARLGLGLVYGGGRTGLMGRVADGVLAGGGTAIGIIPGHLDTPELVHAGLTCLERVPSMHARKARMAELAAAFVALPGGIGTLDELAEILTWAQLGLHRKPVALLDQDGYWDGLLRWLDRAVADRFLAPGHRSLLRTGPDAGPLLADLAAELLGTRVNPPAGQA